MNHIVTKNQERNVFMATTKFKTKRTYHVQVGIQLLLLEVFIDISNNNGLLKSGKMNPDKKSCEWFNEEYVTELLVHLQTIVLQRINSSQPATKALQQELQAQNFKFSYCFKKRLGSVMQYALRRNYKAFYYLENGENSKIKQSTVNYESLLYFDEKLLVNVWQHANKCDKQISNVPMPNKKIKEKENVSKEDASTSSDYFAVHTEYLVTSSVKRKKATLKKIAKKSKIALLKLPDRQSKSSCDSTTECQDRGPALKIECSSGLACDLQKDSKPVKKEKTVIDLEQIPEGLAHIKKVEDLDLNQLKYLVYKMEEYLRTIFRGEVYSRRHEDYKKGGKARINLNFQVGMAHFNEDQHDCIFETLTAIFCYNSKSYWQYMDYVTKVMLPEALIKLYQDIHQTSFDQAEECLLNDTMVHTA